MVKNSKKKCSSLEIVTQCIKEISANEVGVKENSYDDLVDTNKKLVCESKDGTPKI